MSHLITPLQESHFGELHQVFDRVAKEKRYLAFQTAPPLRDTFAFYRTILESGHPHFVALVESRVVGWCDILPTHGESRAHVGTLGIALAEEARNRGIGGALIDAAIANAWLRGTERIELTVRADNHRARSLYENKGFVVEGLNRKSFKVDDEYFDSHSMALVHHRE